MVSIYCLAYNHEKYIRDALDGFVMQKTNFRFEVLIHDDASTDATPDIIAEYANRYDFIKPVFQKENKYQQGISIEKNYFFPITNGKYIAYCEGDDFWTNPNKLQNQVDYMVANPDCSMCCHSYSKIKANTKEFVGEIHTSTKNESLDPETIILYKNPTQLATNMYRRDVLLNMPEVYYNRGVGDYTQLLHAMTQGSIYYMDCNMANHRIESDDSWTNRVFKNPEQRCKHNDTMISFLEDFEAFTNGQYSTFINKKIEMFRMDNAITRHQYKEQIGNPSFEDLSFQRKLLARLGAVSPAIARIIETGFGS